MLTQSEENYLKAIYALNFESSSLVATNDLASKLNTKASSVTDMLKKLADKNYLSYQKYQGCSLTPLGLSTAIAIVRKHRLWEVFLVEKLNFGWEDVHVIAEQLEHIQSNALVDKLADFLGNPQYDPHGDPIPNRNGVFPKVNEFVLLSEAEVNKDYQIMGVKDGDPVFLKYLSTINFALGTTFKITTIYEFDNSIIVTIKNSQIQLSDQVARRITVQSVS